MRFADRYRTLYIISTIKNIVLGGEVTISMWLVIIVKMTNFHDLLIIILIADIINKHFQINT